MISAIVLAAGQSTRMGTQKMLLPWGQTSVIGQVVATLADAGVADIHIVTGGTHAKLCELLRGHKLHFIFNENFMDGEMLTSIQVGIRALKGETEAILIALGDQPQIESVVVRAIIERYQSTGHAIVVPSYKMHRGHPWLIEKSCWGDIMDLLPPLTLRDFLNNHNHEIDYVNVDTPSVVLDLDTQGDYDKYKP